MVYNLVAPEPTKSCIITAAHKMKIGAPTAVRFQLLLRQD